MIFRRLLAIAAFAALAGCASNGERSMAGRPPAHTDISQAFVDFYDRTQGMEEDARLAAFKAEVAPLFPGFYMPRQGRTQEQWDRQVKAQLAGFPAIRDRYVAVQRDFGEAFAEARRRFTRTFPNSRASLPTWLLHSLGEMDGGTREIDGHVVLIFGADGIARFTHRRISARSSIMSCFMSSMADIFRTASRRGARYGSRGWPPPPPSK